jgi:hypothetical protein
MPFDRRGPAEAGVGPQPRVVDERRREATFEVPDEERRTVGVDQLFERPPEAFVSGGGQLGRGWVAARPRGI